MTTKSDKKAIILTAKLIPLLIEQLFFLKNILREHELEFRPKLKKYEVTMEGVSWWGPRGLPSQGSKT